MKKILLIHPEGNFLNNPSLKSLIDLLSENGVQIEIRTNWINKRESQYRDVKLKINGKIWSKVKNIVFNKLCMRSLIKILLYIEYFSCKHNYDCVIGVDRGGLIEAYYLNAHTGVPYVFWSFEISFVSETSAKFKSLEKEAGLKVHHWYTQDKNRAKILTQENSLNLEKSRIVPVASAGYAEAPAKRLRDELGIPSDKKVAILFGSLAKWTMTEEIIASVPDWPNEWCLIIHERYGRAKSYGSALPKKIQKIIGEKVFISEYPVKFVDRVGYILNGCTLGIAFYNATGQSAYTGKNIEHLGLSSGKISTFLRYGVSVIINKIGLYENIIDEARAGLVVSNGAKDISKLLKTNEFSQLCTNAKLLFHSKLDFNIYREAIWRDLSECSRSKISQKTNESQVYSKK